jgi:alpha-N-arabinofuranosidase
MTPEYYSDLYRRYATYCREYDGNKLYKVASGASDYDFNWTEVLAKNIGQRMNGVSLHYYTCKGWTGSKGSATKFTKDDYLWTMWKCLGIEPVIQKHISILDKYDPSNNVGLMVDEWGTWWDEEPGAKSALFQQSSMRDALVAALSLNIFNKYTGRVKMANIAQVVNVLQAMILTNGSKMVLTPTYHVFNMYKAHMNAAYLPSEVACDSITYNDKKIPSVSVSASKDSNGKIHITLANINPDKDEKIKINIGGINLSKISGTILTAKAIDSYNSFDEPNNVVPGAFKDFKTDKTGITVSAPSKSVILLEL